MNHSSNDAPSEERNQELDQLEQDARAAGSMAKARHLDEKMVLSEEAQVAFATGLAQLYLQKYLVHLDVHDITVYMLFYLSFFRDGYNEVKRDGAPPQVRYSSRVY